MYESFGIYIITTTIVAIEKGRGKIDEVYFSGGVGLLIGLNTQSVPLEV
jgi:hypothetical protein